MKVGVRYIEIQKVILMRLRQYQITFLAVILTLGLQSATGADLTWDPGSGGTSDGAGTWLAAGEWWDGGGNVDWTAGDNAAIGSGGEGATITLGTVTAGTVLLDNFTGTYTLSGGSLAQSGGITIGTTAGNVTLNAISGAGGITMNGSGLLKATATLSYTGPSTVNSGVLMLGSSTPAGNWTLNNGMLTDYYRVAHAFTGGLGTGNNQIQIYGDSGFGGGNGTSSWRIGAAGSTLIWGASGEGAATGYFNPTTLKFLCSADNMGPSIFGLVTLDNALDLNGGVRTIEVFSSAAQPVSSLATIARAITGSGGGLTKTGAGTLVLSGANTFDGQLTVDNGALSIGAINNVSANGVLGNSALSVILGASGNTGTLRYTGGTTSSTKPFTLATGGTGAFEVSTASTILTLSGQIDGDGALSNVGAGTLTLTGTSTYTGATTIDAGTVTVDAPGSLAAGSAVTVNSGSTLNGSGTVNGTVTVNSGGTLTGALTIGGAVTLNADGVLTGSGTINGAVTVGIGAVLSTTTITYSGLVTGTAGAAYFSPADLGTIATLNLGNGLTLNAGNEVDCDLGTTSGTSDLIAITGDLDLQGTSYVAFNVPTGSAAANATYTIMTWTGSQTGGGTLVFPNGTTTMDGATLNINANSVTITTGASGITPASQSVTWKGTSSYVWDSSTVNWDVSGTPTTYAYGDNVTFDDTGVAASPITGVPANPGSVTVSSSANNYTIAASIGGSGALTKSGTSTLTLSGNSTFSGGTMIDSGTISINGNNALGANGTDLTFNGSGGLTMTEDMTFDHPVALNNNAVLSVNTTGNPTFSGAITGDGHINWVSGSGSPSLSSPNNTFTGDLTLPTANGTLLLGFASIGDGGLISFRKSGYRANVGYTGSVQLVLNNRRINLTSLFGGVGDGMGYPVNMFENNGTGTVTFNTDMTVATNKTGTFFFGGTNPGNNTYAGIISNSTPSTLSISTYGTGKWIFTNDNTFAGNAIAGGGILSVGKITNAGVAQPLGVGPIIQLAYQNSSGNLEFTGSSNSTTDKQVQIGDTVANRSGAGGIINNGSGTLTFSSATFNITLAGVTSTRTLTLGGSNTGDNTISGIIQNNAAGGLVNLSKTGSGKWVLSGANTFTGTTAVSGGGTLVLDYSTADNSKLSDTAVLTLGGGTITLSGGSHTEIVGSTTLANYTGTRITRASGTSVLQLGSFTRSNGAATLSLSDDSIATTSRNNVNGIIGPWATCGSNWAVNSTDGANGPIIGLTSYTALPDSVGSSTVNYQLTGSQTQTALTTANSLRLVNGNNSDTLTLGNNISLTLTSANGVCGGLLYAGGFDNNYTITGTGTSAIKPASGNNHLAVNVFTGTLTVNALLNSGSGVTAKFGAGTLVVGSDNTGESGVFYVQEGTLRLAHNNAAGTADNTVNKGIIVEGNAALELTDGITVGAEALTIAGAGIADGGALRSVASSASTYGGTITIGDGGARINSDVDGSLTITGDLVTSAFNDVTIGGSGDTTISGVISGAGNLIKDGSGTLTLSGASANTLSGETVVNSGKLAIAATAANAIADSSTLRIASGTKLELDVGVNETVGTFYLDGQPAAPGTWGGLASGATNTDAVYFTGSGQITVSQMGSGTPYEAQGPAGTVIMFR